MRPSLELAACPDYDFFVSWSLQHKKNGLEMTYLSNAEVSV